MNKHRIIVFCYGAQASTSYLKEVARCLFALWLTAYTNGVRSAIECSDSGSLQHRIL